MASGDKGVRRYKKFGKHEFSARRHVEFHDLNILNFGSSDGVHRKLPLRDVNLANKIWRAGTDSFSVNAVGNKRQYTPMRPSVLSGSHVVTSSASSLTSRARSPIFCCSRARAAWSLCRLTMAAVIE